MEQREIYRAQISEMSTFLTNLLADMDDVKICERPGTHLNPIGFIYFHILRVWDLDINILCQGSAPSEDAWHRGGHAEALGYSPDGKGGGKMGIGFGYTDEEVDEIPYQLEPLRAYHQQLIEETHAYLSDADDSELGRSFKVRDQDSSPAMRLQHIVAHSWNHIGEIRMSRSMIGYHDPTTPPRG